jgi:hypothetical protein
MNRRSALGMTATTGIALALSRARAFAQAVGPGPEMSALSTYMSAAGTRALPAEAAGHAKHHLLDTLASMISGSELLAGQAALRYAEHSQGLYARNEQAPSSNSRATATYGSGP